MAPEFVPHSRRLARRGAEPFVPVSWPTAIDLLSHELRRVSGQCGSAAVYGGSYGWSSAGRFHHAQSQLHCFLNCLGGYSASRRCITFLLISLPATLGSEHVVNAIEVLPATK